MSTRDELLIKDFADTWALGYTLHRRSRMEQHLRELLVAAREDESPPTSADAVLGRAETRVQEVFARLAPPGTDVTPELIAKVNLAVAQIVKEELVASGLPEGMATGVAAVLAATMRVKAKRTE